MKLKLIGILVFFFAGTAAFAQQLPDSTHRAPQLDSTLLGKNVFNLIRSGGNGKAQVFQSSTLKNAFESYIRANAARPLSGFRIRVYYDNDQSSRARSENIANQISAAYPGLGVYRTFESPNFKVTVGDFRTKDEALSLFNELKAKYPAAFIIKDNIEYPPVGSGRY